MFQVVVANKRFRARCGNPDMGHIASVAWQYFNQASPSRIAALGYMGGEGASPKGYAPFWRTFIYMALCALLNGCRIGFNYSEDIRRSLEVPGQ